MVMLFRVLTLINLSPLQKSEQGQKKPNGPSLKLLNLVDAHGLDALA